MIPGEVDCASGEIGLSADRPANAPTVATIDDSPVQVGAHQHCAETKPAPDVDRAAAPGMRPDIPAGTVLRFGPGRSRSLRRIPRAGSRCLFGFNGKVMGDL